MGNEALASSLFDELERRGFTIEAPAADQLLVKPRAELSADEAAQIQEHKGVLIELAKHRVMPMLLPDGEVRFPMRFPRLVKTRYRYWFSDVDPNCQSLFATLVELNATFKSWRRYGQYAPELLTNLHRCDSAEKREYPALVEGETTYPAFVCCKGCGWWWYELTEEEKAQQEAALREHREPSIRSKSDGKKKRKLGA